MCGKVNLSKEIREHGIEMLTLEGLRPDVLRTKNGKAIVIRFSVTRSENVWPQAF